MNDWNLKTPIAFIIFRRADNTERVFEAIRQAKPPKLLVVADGPRADRPGEAEKCAATRAIIDSVDWECEVIKNYSDVNMGMKQREVSGFNWIFGLVEEAIILEDDCLPHMTFFRFCEELLEYYRHDTRIMTISGDNSPLGYRRTEDSYYFSHFSRTWGWATWRRAWEYYDVEMKKWPQVRDNNWLKDVLQDDKAVKRWTYLLQSTYEGYDKKWDTWDYQWTLASWMQNGLTIIPNVNLITNLGFGAEGTLTKDAGNPRDNLPVQSLTFPLKHPPFMIRDTQADAFTQRNVYDVPSLFMRAKLKAIKILKNAQ
jgi:hypothetical protein